jgi:hypothetical protein
VGGRVSKMFKVGKKAGKIPPILIFF